GQVVRLPPLVARIVRIPESAVVARDETVRVRWIDPHIVKIAMRAAADRAEARAAVIADHQSAAWFVDAVFVLRIDDEVREVERPPDHVRAAVPHLPREPAVARAVQRIARRSALEDGIDDAGVGWRDGYGDASPRLGPQPF